MCFRFEVRHVTEMAGASANSELVINYVSEPCIRLTAVEPAPRLMSSGSAQAGHGATVFDPIPSDTALRFDHFKACDWSITVVSTFSLVKTINKRKLTHPLR